MTTTTARKLEAIAVVVPDARYRVGYEFTGAARQQIVFRFADIFVGAFDNSVDAQRAVADHAKEREAFATAKIDFLARQWKWKKGDYEVQCVESRKETRTGFLSPCGCFGIAKYEVNGREYWTVSHVPTGLQITGCNRLKTGKALCARLSVFGDWTADNEHKLPGWDYSNGIATQVKQVIRSPKYN